MEKKYQKGIYKTLVTIIKSSLSGSGVEWAVDRATSGLACFLRSSLSPQLTPGVSIPTASPG